MKIRCPQCMKVCEIPHVEHGRIAVCACQTSFRIDDSTVVEEFSLPDLPPPESIGRYTIVRYLGRGTLNCVYEGIHPDRGIPVAIKTLLPEYAADRPTREQFLQSARIYAKAVHPNIVKVYETGKDTNGVPFLVMEFLPGGTLADALQKTPCFPPEKAAEIGAEICRALVVTAGLGIVHRDIKPDNIMISAEGKYKLTDLGLAKIDNSAAAGNGALVLDGNAPDKSARKTSFGTLEYMSPEQYIDSESCDIRSDIYSLGVTLYQLVTGRLPFETQTRSELRHMHISVEPLVPSTYMHGIPIDFDYIVMHCIQKRAEDRYGTPEELLADLEAFLASKPLPSTTSGAMPFVRTPALTDRPEGKGHKSVLPAIAAALCILIMTSAALLILKDCSSTNRKKLLSAPIEEAQSSQEDAVFPGQTTAGTSVLRHSQLMNLYDGDVNNGEDEPNDAKFNQELFAITRDKALEALEKHSGFQNSINDLNHFKSHKECAGEVELLISRLTAASKMEVDKLMTDLNKRAQELIDEGNYDGAANVYEIDDRITPLKQESAADRKEARLIIIKTYLTPGNESDESDESTIGEEIRL